MKKFLIMAALMMVAAFSLTSCGDDDEPKVKTIATTTYHMSFSQDLLEAASIIVYYKAENGRVTFDPITSTWWTKTVTSDEFPAEFGVMYNFGTKPDAELIKEKYDLYCDVTFSFSTNKGASANPQKIVIMDEKAVAKKKVVSTLDKYSGDSKGFKLSENGVPSEANNLKYN
ncbi:MAG: hypothetical protein IJK41_05385 [Muribaculaceae bacterium]|nr:hypothetical protein [Muribaculaceae bacterium]